jgi:hypothetical protein
MKQLFTTISVAIMLAFTACNNGKQKKNEEAATSPAAEEVKTPPAFTPFDIVEIDHSVKDYTSWKRAFDADSVARQANGLNLIVIGSAFDKPNNLAIFLKAADVTKAKAFAADPRLKEVMDKNGVISKPEINYFHVIRFDSTQKEKQWVAITHKVKDFDAWVKVYDNEGAAKRLEQGMVDVVLARGVDDPNLVFIVFDINDMAKAKAAIASDDKKNLMMSAGVMGEPKIVFYKDAE